MLCGCRLWSTWKTFPTPVLSLCLCAGRFFSPALSEVNSLTQSHTHPVCHVRMWWGLLGGVAASSLDGVELLWL